MARRSQALAFLAGAAAVAAAVGVPSAIAGVRPALGVSDREVAPMGPVTSGGRPGETWAYRQYPLSLQLPEFGGQRLLFGAGGSNPSPQLVFLRATDENGWQVAQTPRDENGNPYRGPDPNPRSPRITPKGGGVLVGKDSSRASGARTVVLARNPGGLFRALPAPPAGVLLAAGDPTGQPAEALAGDEGSSTVAVAAADTGSTTTVYIAPTGRAITTGILANDGSAGTGAWRREPVTLAPGETSLVIAGLAAESADSVYASAASAGDPVRLFARTGGGSPSWDEVNLPSTPWTDPTAASAAGLSNLGLLAGKAQSITATADGAWLDLTAQKNGKRVDATIFVRPSAAPPQRVTSWCDLEICDHPLGATFSTTDGYRSYAWAGSGFGTRVISNPLAPSAQQESNQGTYLVLSGDEFERRAGGGGNFVGAASFSSSERGWIGGQVEIGAADPPRRLARWPVAARAPFLAVAGEPGAQQGSLDAGALAVGADGAVARYVPGKGWRREYLLSSSGSVVSQTLRGVAWPQSDRAHAVGDNGAMWLWRKDSGLWERDPATPIGFEGNLMGVAFDPSDPQRGYAVGKGGLILSYDKTWTPMAMPAGFGDANFTSIAFAGRQAIAVSDKGVLFNDGGGWRTDSQLIDNMGTLTRPAGLVSVGGLPDGSAAIGGQGVVLIRDGSSGAWRFASQPLMSQTVLAVAPIREEGSVRAVVSVIPQLQWPIPDTPVDEDPSSPTPLYPAYTIPGDGYLLRETAAGWRDEQRTSFDSSSSDRPLKSDPVMALLLQGDGNGWAVGGWSGSSDSVGRGASGKGARSTREKVRTAGIYRYAADGAPSGSSGERDSPIPLSAGPVRFVVGGHPMCAGPCADLDNQDLAPDRTLSLALDRATGLAGRENGPRAFLATGGRINPDAGIDGDGAEERRYARLMQPRAGLPVFSATAEGDVGDNGPLAFRSAFAGFPAPFGSASAPGISTSGIPGAAPSSGARTHYAFDTDGAGGKVRVIFIDNSAGSLAASDPHQNPAEPQRPWLISVLDDAKSKGIPAIVVGSRDLNSGVAPRLNGATDADEIARLLVEHGASAYFHDRPEENRAATIPAGESVTIPQFSTGTLGYRSPYEDSASIGQPDSLFGTAGFLIAEIDAAKRDAATNRAPVAVRLIPVIEDLSLQATDGNLLRRSRPSLFEGLGRRPVAGDRWGRAGSDGVPSPAGSSPYAEFPAVPCQIAGCSTRINPEFTFSSSAPDVLDFVKQDPASSNLRKPLLGADDKVISDSASGLVCPFNAGTAEVTIAAGGRAITESVTVLPGTVARPCGTRPLDPSRIVQKPAPSTAPAAPPPPPGAAPATLPAILPPPPPAPVTKPNPQKAVPALFGGFFAAGLKLQGPPQVSPPPPPAVFVSTPVPPGGATVKVEKREEEAAPEQSSANYVAVHADERGGLEPYMLGVALLAALAGVVLFRGGRRRDPDLALTRTTFEDPRSRTYRRQS